MNKATLPLNQLTIGQKIYSEDGMFERTVFQTGISKQANGDKVRWYWVSCTKTDDRLHVKKQCSSGGSLWSGRKILANHYTVVKPKNYIEAEPKIELQSGVRCFCPSLIKKINGYIIECDYHKLQNNHQGLDAYRCD